MKIIKKYLIFIFITIITLSGCFKNSIAVHIQNNSDSEIKEVTLEFTGGNEKIPVLPIGKEFILKINPTGESSLSINFSDKNTTYKKNLDTYFEPNYKGHCFIKIENRGKITFDSKISL